MIGKTIVLSLLSVNIVRTETEKADKSGHCKTEGTYILYKANKWVTPTTTGNDGTIIDVNK